MCLYPMVYITEYDALCYLSVIYSVNGKNRLL